MIYVVKFWLLNFHYYMKILARWPKSCLPTNQVAIEWAFGLLMSRLQKTYFMYIWTHTYHSYAGA